MKEVVAENGTNDNNSHGHDVQWVEVFYGITQRIEL
jgi:hypothetical protein